MFSGSRFPYSDFNKVNLDWCMRHLPIDCKLTEVDNSKAAFIQYTAVLMGEYILADIQMFLFDTLPTNTGLFTIPFKAAQSYMTTATDSVSVFVDEDTNIMRINRAYSGNLEIKCLIKIQRGK